ncbi:hypothetical protein [Helicobacter pylori]|uniref:hypothetical protein n=1 Tax=Helicobacter pylori TaxID=210 RepID=UPI003F8EE9A0
MEKILAFFIPSFFIPSLFSSLSGGGGYKPTLNLLESPKSPILFKLLKFRLLTLLKGDNSCWIKMCY